MTCQEQSAPPAPPEQESRRSYWHRQATVTARVGVFSKGVVMATRFFMIPLALNLLGPEPYGLWLTVMSLLGWLGFAGAGIGYGLVNALSHSEKDAEHTRRVHISTAVFTLTGLAVLLLCASIRLSTWPGLQRILGVSPGSTTAAEAPGLMLVAGLVFSASFALDFLGPMCLGLQQGYLTSLTLIFGNLAALAAVAVVAQNHGNVIDFAMAAALPPVLANLGLAVYLFWIRHPSLRPSVRLWNQRSFRAVMTFGGYMLIVHLGDLVTFQAPNILISHRYGAAAVPTYAIAASIFINVSNVCYLLVSPYWPAFVEAKRQGDWTWVKATVFRTVKITVGLMSVAALGMVLVGRAFIHFWAGQHAVPPFSLLACMAVHFVLVAWVGNNNILLLSLGLVRLKVLLTVMVVIVQIGGFWVLAPRLGMAALPVAGSIGALVEGITAFAVAFSRIRAGTVSQCLSLRSV